MSKAAEAGAGCILKNDTLCAYPCSSGLQTKGFGSPEEDP